jgi:tetratricopeptide (TPR) repeat protein
MAQEVEELLNRAAQARREERLEDARQDLAQALNLSREHGNEIYRARALKGLGQIERDLGNGEAALELYERAAAIYRSAGHEPGLAHTIRHVADIQQELGRREVAEPCYREALAIYRRHPETSALDLANVIRGLAILTFDAGQTEETRALWGEARDLYAAADVQAGVNESSRRLALLADQR